MNDLPTFGPYHLFERVSVGGMAEVFKAMEYGADGFEREVAVKRILPHVAEDEEFITMFKDEAHIAVQLKHGNIAQIYNLGFENDTFYIALEFVLGKDARTIFERCRQAGSPLPIAQACFTVMQVCEGLDYAHNKKDKYGRPLNIIHRDVSPPNILVSYEGEVKLIDFGVAKAAGRASHTQSGILKGKFGYMSPEQVKGRALDRRSDVFAIGVVLWELLCGRRLFQGDTDFATLEKVRAVDISVPSAVNPKVNAKLEAIVLKALAAEPDDRYQSAMELHDALQAFMFEDGIFASRKDLAAWMRDTFAAEIEEEKKKVAKRPPPARGQQSKKRAARSTMMMGPGQMPGMPGAPGGPPAPPGAPRKGPPVPPGGGPPAPPPSRAPGAPPPQQPRPSPRGRPSNVPTQAHKVVSANVPGGPPKPKGRARAKTMLMSPKQAPVGLPAPAAKPKPAARPKPKPKPKASYDAPASGSDFDWDDDELETRLFDEPPAAAAAAAAGPAGRAAAGPAPRPAANPIATGAPPPQPASGAMPNRPPASPSGPAQQTPAAAPAAAPMPAAAPPVQAAPAAAYAEPERSNKPPVWLWILAAVLGLALVGGIVYAIVGGDDEDKSGQSADASTGSAATGAVAAASSGSVSLSISPSDAVVKVDGKEVSGSGSPRVLGDLSAGSHKIEVIKEGDFLSFAQDVTVVAGQALPLDVKLELAKVTLSVKSDPGSTSVTLLAGDKKVALGKGATVKHNLTREAGVTYKLLGEAAGYESSEIPLVFDGQAVQTVSLSLVQKAGAASSGTGTKKVKKKRPAIKKTTKAKTAELRIGVAPGNPPADVYVDGRKQSKKTPVFVKVTPGGHTVKWSWGGKTSTQRVSVGDGESKTVKGKR